MRIGLGTMLATVLMAMFGCGPKAHSPRELPKPPVVSLTVPTRTSVPSVIDQPGQIEAYEQTPIYARISGFVRSVYVDIGARVAKGQVLAELDVPERVEEHHRKEALVEQARARRRAGAAGGESCRDEPGVHEGANRCRPSCVGKSDGRARTVALGIPAHGSPGRR